MSTHVFQLFLAIHVVLEYIKHVYKISLSLFVISVQMKFKAREWYSLTYSEIYKYFMNINTIDIAVINIYVLHYLLK